ncbi:hypothetical protein BMS3Abin07_01294 [bacterium BMS3Abin07]|nr:hypothetical protein BMS3Abin07_01294 [bacterium BMS3Abin07]GBE33138.1 hypothetical protein BMS3Bbin05_02076 [bacterium BMS3Bbin05]
MKRIICITGCLVVLLALVSCGSTSGSSGSSLVTISLGEDSTASISVTKATLFAKLKLILEKFGISTAAAAIPSNVETVRITVDAPDMAPILKTVNVAGLSSVTVTVDVPNGMKRHFLVECLDISGTVIYLGEMYIDLTGGRVSLPVSLADLYSATGAGDNTFGAGGVVTTPVSTGPSDTDEGQAIAMQSDGKIVVAGYVYYGFPVSQGDFLVIRYNPDGTPDQTFNRSGIVTADLGGGANATDDYAYDVAIQSDGKIVVVGKSNGNLAIARYNTDGSPDTVFGSSGVYTYDFGNGYEDVANAVAIQGDGKIIVAGYTTDISSSTDYLVIRYDPVANGLDASFGTNGIVKMDLSGAGHSDKANALAIQPDGLIVAAGYANNGNDYDFAVLRLDTAGKPDTSFGSGGWVTTDIAADFNSAYTLAIQQDGRIIVAGDAVTDPISGVTSFALVRYNPDGSMDDTFGVSGVVTTAINPLGSNAINDIAIQPDGRIVATGRSFSADSFDTPVVVVRYNTDGSINTSFGNNGVVQTSIGVNTSNIMRGVVLQPDGKIVVAGSTGDGYSDDVAVVRYR